LKKLKTKIYNITVNYTRKYNLNTNENLFRRLLMSSDPFKFI